MIVRRILLALSLAAVLPLPSYAQQGGQLLGQFTDWAAYTASTDKGKICFVISQPKRRAPEGLNRDPAYFFVTDRPKDNVRNEVSMQVGFPTKNGSAAAVSIGGQDFDLITDDDRAWSNGKDDAHIVEAMRKGSDMTIKTTSSRGNLTTDSYSLSGISAALDRIGQECR
jgi:hypothetical protein